jgi:3-oxoacyl-[acyl-carrier-protein] synthase II
MKRVVITGMAAITPIGQTWETVAGNLHHLRTGTRYMPEWEEYQGLNTRLAAPVADFAVPAHYTRKMTRSMGRGSMMATVVTEQALQQAGLLHEALIHDGSMGVSYGSSSGSPGAIMDFGSMMITKTANMLNANTYIKMMPHTGAVNLAVFFQLKGRIYTTSSACTSGSQGIGYGYEAIKHGQQSLMVCGGMEELSPIQAAVFDTLFATSTRNGEPHTTPSPFARNRDGLVVGEGAATLILEELEHARARGATILAELVGFGTNCDGEHVTQPSRQTMRIAMELALRDAGLDAAAVGYVSAHGTATELGDIAESHATRDVFGGKVPISAMKSFTGHTLGACGAIEAWAGIAMMNSESFHATANLDEVDDRCAELDYIRGQARNMSCEYIMSNNFAFGGINTSLIFKRWR